MRKINSIDEFYEERATLEELKDKLGRNYPLFEVSVKENGAASTLVISLFDVFRGIKKEHQINIYWRLKRLLEDVSEKVISVQVIKELTAELEEKKEEIRKDFDLGGEKS